MKKILSVLLVVSMLFVFPAVIASAEIGDYQTYRVTYKIEEEGIYITPVEGYYTVIEPGESFKFTVEVDRDEKGEPLYTDALAVVQTNGKTIQPDIYGIYTIEGIEEDQEITVFFSFDKESGNLFTSLMLLVRRFLKAIYDTIQNLIKAGRT